VSDFDATKFMPSSEYLGAIDIYGKDPIEVEIERVEERECTFEKGRKEQKGLLHFKGCKKPLVLGNKSVLKTLILAFGRQTSSWVGRRVELYTVDTKMRGEPVKGIRVRPALGDPQ